MFFNRFKFSCRLISDFKDFLLCPQPACCLISKCVFWSFVTRFFNLLFLAKLHLWRYFAKASVGEGGGDYMCCEHNWNLKLLATWVYNAKLVLPGGEDYMCCQHNCNFKLPSTFSFTHSWFRKLKCQLLSLSSNSTIVRNHHHIILCNLSNWLFIQENCSDVKAWEYMVVI